MSGVTMVEQSRKGTLPMDPKADTAARDVITERLYTCPNGWQLGARRGGRLHLAGECEAHPDGEATWEIFVLNAHGIGVGDSAGWVTEEQLATAVARLAEYAPAVTA